MSAPKYAVPEYVLNRATRLMFAGEAINHLAEIAEELLDQAEVEKDSAEILHKHVGYTLNAMKLIGDYAKLDGIKLFDELRFEWPGNVTRP